MVHPCHFGVPDIGTIDEGQDIQERERGQKMPIDFADDLFRLSCIKAGFLSDKLVPSTCSPRLYLTYIASFKVEFFHFTNLGFAREANSVFRRCSVSHSAYS